ncbi:MAG: Hsp70 family protein, partial [Pseudomonadota bacterium]|nr:Hsp70 family protein [Pseudomonadota bacterium]
VDEVVMVGGATHMVAVRKLVANLFGVDPRRTVDPMQAVALGAAAHCGVLTGEVRNVRVLQAWQAELGRLLDVAREAALEEEVAALQAEMAEAASAHPAEPPPAIT